MNQKELRKTVFRQMLEQGKKWKNVKRIYKIIFLMEEYCYTKQEAELKLCYPGIGANRHTYRLYFLRKSFLEKGV